MKRIFLAIFAILFALTTVASAATVTYNTSLSSPPGVYYGSGNPNANWAVYNDGQIELGLTAFIRYTGGSTVSSNTYTVPLGSTTVPGKTGSAWGFAFSANTLGGANLNDYTYSVKLESIGGGGSVTFNPLLIPDNSYWGVGGKTGVQDLPNQTGFQNAEAPSFGFIAVPLGYDSMDNETYRITITALKVPGLTSITSLDKIFDHQRQRRFRSSPRAFNLRPYGWRSVYSRPDSTSSKEGVKLVLL